MFQAHLDLINYVNSLGRVDNYSMVHTLSVASIAIAFAEYLGHPAYNLHLAAMAHDIGKIGVDKAILSKPSKLTDEEYAIVQLHPTIGANIIRALFPFAESAGIVSAVEHHHERWNGSGYPHGLKEEDIPEAARIIALVDSYDAMTSTRTYHSQHISPEKAVAEIQRCAGTHFDPVLAEKFAEFILEGICPKKGGSFKLVRPPSQVQHQVSIAAGC